MGNLVIISQHEKGFWQGDLYWDADQLTSEEMEQMGLSPDAFFTLGRDSTEAEARLKAAQAWPGATIVATDRLTGETEGEE